MCQFCGCTATEGSGSKQIHYGTQGVIGFPGPFCLVSVLLTFIVTFLLKHSVYSLNMQVSSLYSEEQVVYIQQHKLVECTDPNGNTPVSEAAAGGDPDTIR